MISTKKLSPLIIAMPNSKLLASNSELILVDKHGELAAELDEDRGSVLIYNNYTHVFEVYEQLKKVNFEVRIIPGDLAMNKATLHKSISTERDLV